MYHTGLIDLLSCRLKPIWLSVHCLTQNKIQLLVQLSQNSFFPFVKKNQKLFLFCLAFFSEATSERLGFRCVWLEFLGFEGIGCASCCLKTAKPKLEAAFGLAPWYTPPWSPEIWLTQHSCSVVPPLALQVIVETARRCGPLSSNDIQLPAASSRAPNRTEYQLFGLAIKANIPRRISWGEACNSLWYQLIHQTWFHNCIISVALENRNSCCLVLVCQCCCMIMTIDVIFCVKNCKYWPASLAFSR